MYNNKLYFGNSSNVPTVVEGDLSNYVTQDMLSSYTQVETFSYTGQSSELSTSRNINIGTFDAKYIVVYSVDAWAYYSVTPVDNVYNLIWMIQIWNTSIDDAFCTLNFIGRTSSFYNKETGNLKIQNYREWGNRNQTSPSGLDVLDTTYYGIIVY